MTPRTAYALSFLALVAAVLLRWALVPLIGYELPFVTLFGAVAAAVWLCGWQAGVAVAVLGYFAADILFIEPYGRLGLEERAHWVGAVAYCFTCGLIVAFGEALRVSRARARARQELLRVTLASIGDAVITTDLDGYVTDLNPAAAKLTGWTLEQARGQPLLSVFNIVNEATRKPVESPAARALREGVVVGLANHTVLTRRDGSEIAIDDSAAPIRDERGHVSGCVLVFRDVTGQRHAEMERERQLHTARLLASIVESSDDAILSKSLDGTIQTWNTAAERLFGYKAEDAIGRHISLVIPPERMAEEDRIVESLKVGIRIDHFETERLRADGHRIPVSLTISPIKDDHGRIVGASKIVRDITERRRADEDLQRLAEDLAESDRRKDHFLAALAHELRNPLAPLANTLEVLKRSGGDPATLQRGVQAMERQLAQLTRLVDDLLDLNRITHDRMELRQAQVELNAEIQQAVDAIRPVAQARGHALRVSLPAEPVRLFADPVRLAQVFGNLLHNACKYTPPGGTIEVVARREGSDAVVSVRDTGCGIPPHRLHDVFEMFMQLDRALERSQGGLGIGLTMVRRLVQMHGGSVEARSEGEGRGSEFIVRLPLLDGLATPEAVEPGQEASGHDPGHAAPVQRILVVDDNVDAAESLAELLKLGGHTVNIAHDGREALAMIERERPDAVLLDIGLPGLTGYEVCRRARTQPWGRDIAFIALSGWAKEEDMRASRDAGFDGHLVKPVDFDALLDLLAAPPRRAAPEPAVETIRHDAR